MGAHKIALQPQLEMVQILENCNHDCNHMIAPLLIASVTYMDTCLRQVLPIQEAEARRVYGAHARAARQRARQHAHRTRHG